MTCIESHGRKEQAVRAYWALTSACAPMSLTGSNYYFIPTVLYYRCSYAKRLPPGQWLHRVKESKYFHIFNSSHIRWPFQITESKFHNQNLIQNSNKINHLLKIIEYLCYPGSTDVALCWENVILCEKKIKFWEKRKLSTVISILVKAHLTIIEKKSWPHECLLAENICLNMILSRWWNSYADSNSTWLC